MHRFTQILSAIVVIEALGLAALAVLPSAAPQPVAPALDYVSSVNRAEIERLQREVQQGRPKALSSLADRYLAFGFFTAAELCCREAIRQQPGSFELAHHRAICLDRLGQLPLAVEEYHRAIRLARPDQNPPASVCWYHIGCCHLRSEDQAQAEFAFRQTGDFPLGRYQLARLLARSERIPEALPLLTALLEQYPNELRLLLLGAYVQRTLGHPAEAASFRERCLRAENRFFVDSTIEFLGLLRAGFGLVRERNESLQMAAGGRPDEAIQRLQQLQADEWDLKTALALIDLQLRLRRGEPALTLLDEITRRTGLLPETLEKRGDAFVLLGNRPQAVSAWEHSLRLRPSASVSRKLSEACQETGQAAAAAEHKGRSLRESGITAFRENSLQSAADSLRQATALIPEDSRTWFYLAETQQAAGQSEDARQSYERCLRIDPAHHRAGTRLKQLSEGGGTTP